MTGLRAALTGVTIAAYTLVDGGGVRLSGAPLAYASWLFFLHGVSVPLTAFSLSHDRDTFFGSVRAHWRIELAGSAMSLIAYGIVVWAQSVAPLALVSASRSCRLCARRASSSRD